MELYFMPFWRTVSCLTSPPMDITQAQALFDKFLQNCDEQDESMGRGSAPSPKQPPLIHLEGRRRDGTPRPVRASWETD